MARAGFKQADVERAVRAARAAGVKVATIEVTTADGVTIRITGPCAAPRNPWDEVYEPDDQDPTKVRS